MVSSHYAQEGRIQTCREVKGFRISSDTVILRVSKRDEVATQRAKEG